MSDPDDLTGIASNTPRHSLGSIGILSYSSGSSISPSSSSSNSAKSAVNECLGAWLNYLQVTTKKLQGNSDFDVLLKWSWFLFMFYRFWIIYAHLGIGWLKQLPLSNNGVCEKKFANLKNLLSWKVKTWNFYFIGTPQQQQQPQQQSQPSQPSQPVQGMQNQNPQSTGNNSCGSGGGGGGPGGTLVATQFINAWDDLAR